jgi:hypothetical protein
VARMRRRIGVVSYLTYQQYEPRGLRTMAILRALEREWDVDLVAGPQEQLMGSVSPVRRVGRSVHYHASRPLALDTVEWWSRRHLARWSADVDAALLIARPFSPVVEASRRLAEAGVPFIVDTGDPWVIGAVDHGLRGIALHRARSAERRIWETAAGAILTTVPQERALLDRFGHLRTLVRPNGFTDVPGPARPPRRPLEDGILRIGHFGNLYAPRVDLRPFVARLCASRHWNRVILEQYGQDWNRTLAQLPPELEVRVHEPAAWPDVVQIALGLDIALVVGNVGGIQLPSKVIEYLTLPVPRVALVDRPADDAISEYVRDKPGWLIVGPDEEDAADRLATHLGRPWPPAVLAAPPSESWDAVGREIAMFASRSVLT